MAFVLWNKAQGGIYIDNSVPGFFAACSGDLNSLCGKPIGQTLIDLLVKRAKGIGTTHGKAVSIEYTNTLGSVAQSSKNLSAGAPLEVRKNSVPGRNFQMPAVGDSSLVSYGHDMEGQYTAAIGTFTPSYIALGHELIHALHVISGDVVMEYDWSTQGAIIEEARTVGLGPYKNSRITENALRKERGLQLRTYYHSPGDADHLVSVT